MNTDKKSDNPINYASAALAFARKIRARASEAEAIELCEEAYRSLERIVTAFGDRGDFSEEFLDDLRKAIATFEELVSEGTTIGFDVHEAWDDRGAETTAIHSTRELTPEARQLDVVLADLRQLATLIEGTLDLVTAEAVVAALRDRSR